MTLGLDHRADVGENLGPLHNPLFRKMWLASTVSNVGGWMQDTAGIWLMTSLTASPLPVALMQTAASLPVVLLGLLAGATADIFDRRRLLLFWQAWMLVVVAVLALLSFANVISPWILLSLTCFLNVGGAMNGAAWQAIVPELVSHEQLPDAVSLNSAGFNLARSLGPALGGLTVALFHQAHTGAAATFLLNAVSFLGVIFALYQWKRTPLFRSALPAERILGSMTAGLRYAEHSPVLKALLARSFLFTCFVSAVWSLLPVVAARDLHRGALSYGILNGCMGLGAVIGAASLPRIRRTVSPDQIVMSATAVFAATLFILAFVRTPLVLIPILMLAGFAWTGALSTLNLAVQLSSPTWVQARAIGLYQMVFSAGLAIGSVFWGLLAKQLSTSASLAIAGLCLLLSMPISFRLHIHTEAREMVQPSALLPSDQLADGPGLSVGPVRLHIDYQVSAEDYDSFVHSLYELKEVRLRNGAIRWGIFQDVYDATRLSETFIMESWVEYLRQQERLTASDTELMLAIAELHRGTAPPYPMATIFVKEMIATSPTVRRAR